MNPDDTHSSTSGDRLLDPESARQQLSLGRSKFEQLLRSGALCPVWIDGARRVRQSEIDRFIAELPSNRGGERS